MGEVDFDAFADWYLGGGAAPARGQRCACASRLKARGGRSLRRLCGKPLDAQARRLLVAKKEAEVYKNLLPAFRKRAPPPFVRTCTRAFTFPWEMIEFEKHERGRLKDAEAAAAAEEEAKAEAEAEAAASAAKVEMQAVQSAEAAAEAALAQRDAADERAMRAEAAAATAMGEAAEAQRELGEVARARAAADREALASDAILIDQRDAAVSRALAAERALAEATRRVGNRERVKRLLTTLSSSVKKLRDKI